MMSMSVRSYGAYLGLTYCASTVSALSGVQQRDTHAARRAGGGCIKTSAAGA